MLNRKSIQLLFGLTLLFSGVAAKAAQTLSSNDVAVIISQALTRAHFFLTNHTTTNGVIAVVDREGFVLGVWSLQPNPSGLDVIDAITKAGTAAFLSSDQNSFTSRTAGYIVQQHFPPTIANTPTGPLVGVNFANMSFSDVNRFKDPHTYNPAVYGGGGTNGDPITGLDLAALSGLAGSPGGVPLYKSGELVGGVGAAVTGKPPIPELYDIQQTAGGSYDVDEDVALAAQRGYGGSPNFYATHVIINGISLPYVDSTTRNSPLVPLDSLGFGAVFEPYEITNSPPVIYPKLTLGGVAGEVRQPIINDPLPGQINGEARLSAAEVKSILKLAAQRAIITRAGIRLPVGQSARVFITVVNNPNAPGIAPVVLGTFRVAEATMFSWDVAVQKARTALYFSSDEHAYSVRAVGFLAQEMYPPGIARSLPGPYYGYQEVFSLLPAYVILNGLSVKVVNPLNQVSLTAAQVRVKPDPALPNGITIFPGGFPLYRNGKMIGAIGVSGDGVDQDDIIAASGTENFLAPLAIRSDQIFFRGTRLPYAKFPRNPSL
jgi:uncharacterized protein GlcG (DUF336 family)